MKKILLSAILLFSFAAAHAQIEVVPAGIGERAAKMGYSMYIVTSEGYFKDFTLTLNERDLQEGLNILNDIEILINTAGINFLDNDIYNGSFLQAEDEQMLFDTQMLLAQQYAETGTPFYLIKRSQVGNTEAMVIMATLSDAYMGHKFGAHFSVVNSGELMNKKGVIRPEKLNSTSPSFYVTQYPWKEIVVYTE